MAAETVSTSNYTPTLDSLVGTDHCFVSWNGTGHIARASNSGARKLALCKAKIPKALATLVARRWFGDLCEDCERKYRNESEGETK